MNVILEILKYILPAIIVLITAYLVIKRVLQNDEKKQRIQMVLNNQKTVTPIRLQAYERIVLLLERISIESVLTRVHKKGMTTKQLQIALVTAIKNEFQHNLTQQIYISSQAWQIVRKAKENIVKLINSEAGKLDPNTPSINLSKALLERLIELSKSPAEEAIGYIKNEVAQLF